MDFPGGCDGIRVGFSRRMTRSVGFSRDIKKKHFGFSRGFHRAIKATFQAEARRNKKCTPKKFIFREGNFLTLRLKTFLYFLKKSFLIFQEIELSYISENGTF